LKKERADKHLLFSERRGKRGEDFPRKNGTYFLGKEGSL